MPEICAVPGCENKRSPSTMLYLSFHKIPKDEPLRAKWLKAIGKNNWDPAYGTRICSEHFKEEEIIKSADSGQRRLLKNVVPSFITKDSANADLSSPLPVPSRKRKFVPSAKASPVLRERPAKKIKLEQSTAKPKKIRVVKSLPMICMPNEKQTQTSSSDWCRTTKMNSNKSVQVNLPVHEDDIDKKKYYGFRNVDISKFDNLHCMSLEEHKARYRMGALYKEIQRLGRIKEKQNHLITRLKLRHGHGLDLEKSDFKPKKMDSADVPKASLTVMGSERETHMDQTDSSLPVVYVSNMDVQCVAKTAAGQ